MRTIPVTERYGTVGDDLVEREPQRLVEYRANGQLRLKRGRNPRGSSRLFSG
jgi:hypothetical protein